MDRSVLLIFVAMLLGAAGQLSLKVGMNQVGAVESVSMARPWEAFVPIFSQPLVWVGLALYGVSSLIWLIVLSRLDLSYAYPLLASMYIVLPLLSMVFLKESIPPLRWLGMLVVIAGVILVSRG